MTPTKLTALAFAALLSVTAAATAFAATAQTPDEMVAARQAAMKQDGRALRGAADLTGDQAIEVLTTVETNFRRLPSLFAEGTITGDSGALPIIWEQFDQFSAIFDKAANAAADGIAAVKAGDMNKYRADVKALGAVCSECHTTYRAKRS